MEFIQTPLISINGEFILHNLLYSSSITGNLKCQLVIPLLSNVTRSPCSQFLTLLETLVNP